MPRSEQEARVAIRNAMTVAVAAGLVLFGFGAVAAVL